MSSKFVEETSEDNVNDDTTSDQLEVGNISDFEPVKAAPKEVKAEPPVSESKDDDDDVPEKYKGKSAKEIARMHMEVEKALGRQGSEVGELRRIVDDFVKSQANKKPDQTVNDEVEDEVDFFTDPQKAIDKAIAKHPKIREAEEVTSNMRKAEALANLKANHPDFQEIITSPAFAEWIGNSKVRQELFVRADQRFDTDAANELLSNWKERAQVVERTKAVEAQERNNAVKAASTGSTKGSSEPASKKRFRRSDIIDLMTRDPDRYMALEPEIMKAYAEKRVY
jgi:hypothetical protein